jgi:tetratricopeptide (TPR) repeat protein
VDSAAGSVDAQLDFAEFALSLFEPFAGMFDPARATADQNARFAQMVERYCETNEIDLGLIPAGPLRDRCIARQLEILQTRAPGVPTNGEAFFYRAELHKAAGQTAAALENYRRSAQLNPLDVRALNEIGILLCQNRQLQEGMEQFRKVLEIDPRQAEAHVNLATAYYNSGQPVLAESHFKEALRIDPDFPAAREGIRVLQNRRHR